MDPIAAKELPLSYSAEGHTQLLSWQYAGELEWGSAHYVVFDALVPLGLAPVVRAIGEELKRPGMELVDPFLYLRATLQRGYPVVYSMRGRLEYCGHQSGVYFDWDTQGVENDVAAALAEAPVLRPGSWVDTAVHANVAAARRRAAQLFRQIADTRIDLVCVTHQDTPFRTKDAHFVRGRRGVRRA